jgi:UDP-glucose 4-epimerase
VVVTGAAGFIGRSLVRALIASDVKTVVAVDVRPMPGVHDPTASHCEIVPCERSVLQPLDDLLDGADVVFHLAAQVGVPRSICNPYDDATTNVLGTLAVLESCRRVGVGRVVYSSSAAVYGSPQYVPIDENHPTHPRSPYGLAKLAAERYAMIYGELYDLSVLALRYFNVYGPNQPSGEYAAVIPLFADRVARKLPLVISGDGAQTRDFVHVRDVVRANFLAARSRSREVLNVGSGRATSIRELALLIGGPEYPVVHEPPRPGDVPHSVASVEAARTQIGYAPSISLEEGLGEFLGV